MTQRHQRVDVQVDHAQIGTKVPFHEFAMPAKARIVDQHVDACAVEGGVKRLGVVSRRQVLPGRCDETPCAASSSALSASPRRAVMIKSPPFAA